MLETWGCAPTHTSTMFVFDWGTGASPVPGFGFRRQRNYYVRLLLKRQ